MDTELTFSVQTLYTAVLLRPFSEREILASANNASKVRRCIASDPNRPGVISVLEVPPGFLHFRSISLSSSASPLVKKLPSKVAEASPKESLQNQSSNIPKSFEFSSVINLVDSNIPPELTSSCSLPVRSRGILKRFGMHLFFHILDNINNCLDSIESLIYANLNAGLYYYLFDNFDIINAHMSNNRLQFHRFRCF